MDRRAGPSEPTRPRYSSTCRMCMQSLGTREQRVMGRVLRPPLTGFVSCSSFDCVGVGVGVVHGLRLEGSVALLPNRAK